VRALKVALGLAAALLVHVVGVWAFPALPRYLDLFLVVAALNALGGSSAAGLLGGAASGLVHDTLSGRLYGFHGFADTIAGYALARAAQRLDITRPGAVVLAVALVTLLQQAVLIALAHLFTDPGEPPELVPVLVRAVADGAVAALLWTLTRRVRGARERVRRKRMAKIRL
jgi:rod shape-determining protein MreD